jgi:hypothetical protein
MNHASSSGGSSGNPGGIAGAVGPKKTSRPKPARSADVAASDTAAAPPAAMAAGPVMVLAAALGFSVDTCADLLMAPPHAGLSVVVLFSSLFLLRVHFSFSFRPPVFACGLEIVVLNTETREQSLLTGHTAAVWQRVTFALLLTIIARR